MAEKAEQKPDAAPTGPPKEPAEKHDVPAKAAGKAGGGGLLAKTPVMIGLVMVIEAAVLFAGFKFIGGGAKQASAVDLAHEIANKDPHGEGGGHRRVEPSRQTQHHARAPGAADLADEEPLQDAAGGGGVDGQLRLARSRHRWPRGLPRGLPTGSSSPGRSWRRRRMRSSSRRTSSRFSSRRRG